MTPAQCQHLPKSTMTLQIKTLLSFKRTDERPRRKIRAVDSCSFLETKVAKPYELILFLVTFSLMLFSHRKEINKN